MGALGADEITYSRRNGKLSRVSLWSRSTFAGDCHERVETRQGRRRSLARDATSDSSRDQDAAELVFAARDDEQAVVQAGDLEYASDPLVDTGENQEPMAFKEAVMRRDKDSETGAVEEGHRGEIEADDTATHVLLLLENVGEGVLRGKVKLSDRTNGSAQRIEIDDGQLVPEIAWSNERLNTSHDDAPRKELASPGV